MEMSYAESVQNMAAHTKVDWLDIMKMTSLNPAKYIHVDDRKGKIAPGMDADLTINGSGAESGQRILPGKRVPADAKKIDGRRKDSRRKDSEREVIKAADGKEETLCGQRF